MGKSKSSVVKPAAEKKVKEKNIILENVLGEEVDPMEYFYVPETATDEEKEKNPVPPPYFNKAVGYPVKREELVEIFNKVFKPADNFLFYRVEDKELYVVIIPLKFTEIGPDTDGVIGDFQKHAISFVMEGSVNLETLKTKLQRIAVSVRYKDR